MAKIVYIDEHGKKNGMLSGAITSEVLFAFVGQDKLLPRATFYLKIGKHKDENGELIDDYVFCVCWRKLAKFVRHFKRGMTVIVTGAFYTSKRKENGAWVEEEQFFCETFMPQVWRYRKIVKDKLEEGDYQKEDDTPYTSRKPDGYDF